MLALGARPRDAVVGALTFRGPEDDTALAGLLEQASAGQLHRIAFVVPAGASWPLPIYELALLTAAVPERPGDARNVEIVVVTPEERPLALFGSEASEAIQELLDIRGVDVEVGAAAVAWQDGMLTVAGGTTVAGGRGHRAPAAASARRLSRAPSRRSGFVPTDAEGRVSGTCRRLRRRRCDAVPPEAGRPRRPSRPTRSRRRSPRMSGADVRPMPFRPVLRGLLFTGFVPRYLRADTGTGTSLVDTEPLWWPPAKIVGRYLAPFLAAHLGLEADAPGACADGRGRGGGRGRPARHQLVDRLSSSHPPTQEAGGRPKAAPGL